jgi:hypothetical protein
MVHAIATYIGLKVFAGYSISDHLDVVAIPSAGVPHPQFLHDPKRGDIRRIGIGDHLRKCEDVKTIAQHGCGSFGRESLSPVGRSQTVEQFHDCGGIKKADATKTDERLVSPETYHPQPKAVAGEAGNTVLENRRSTFFRDDMVIPQVPSHVRIGP